MVTKVFGPLVFKSDPEYYSKEIVGMKPNTARILTKDDPRFQMLQNIMKRGRYGEIGHRYIIFIKDTKTGKIFGRYITDVSFWKNICVISWNPYSDVPATMLRQYRCEQCDLKQCPENCFNRHEGNMIALRKVCDATGKKVHIIGEHQAGKNYIVNKLNKDLS